MTTLDEVLSGAIGPGVHTLDEATSVFDADERVGQRGWELFHVDGSEIADKDAFLRAVARACRFPATFGNNWDALADSLSDLSWAPANGYVLLYDHHTRFRSRPDWTTVLDIFSDAAQRWSEAEIPFFVLLR